MKQCRFEGMGAAAAVAACAVRRAARLGAQQAEPLRTRRCAPPRPARAARRPLAPRGGGRRVRPKGRAESARVPPATPCSRHRTPTCAFPCAAADLETNASRAVPGGACSVRARQRAWPQAQHWKADHRAAEGGAYARRRRCSVLAWIALAWIAGLSFRCLSRASCEGRRLLAAHCNICKQFDPSASAVLSEDMPACRRPSKSDATSERRRALIYVSAGG